MRRCLVLLGLCLVTISSFAKNMPDLVDAGLKAYDQKNYQEALADFKTAAEAGDSQAQNNLGAYYLQSPSIKNNYKQAKYWLGKSASQNNKMGIFNLAYLYINGKSVPKDINKGIEYYKKSAALNYIDAQRHLGFLYYQGRLVKQNLEQAYLYFSLAAQNEDTTSANMLPVLSKQMTPIQLKQANNLVKNYKFASTNN